MVVYSDSIATSATDNSNPTKKPFSAASGRSGYNHAYSYFLKTCQKFGLSAAFCTSDSIIGAGTCKGFWAFQNNGWTRNEQFCYSRQIFDKFSPLNLKKILQRQLLFSSDQVQPFNNPVIASLFFDKHSSYTKLSKYAIPTVTIGDNTNKSINQSLKKLRRLVGKQKNQNDFGQSVIVKNRYGAGGEDLFMVADDFQNKIRAILEANPKLSFVIQPMINFKKGFSYKNQTGAADIRLIYKNGKIIQNYVRMAKQGDFRCNAHQGGSVLYPNLKDIPTQVLQAADKILKVLDQNESLFTLDFIVSDHGNAYFLEGNVGPGINWDDENKKDKQMSKKLINSIVEEFSERVLLRQGLENVANEDFDDDQIAVW